MSGDDLALKVAVEVSKRVDLEVNQYISSIHYKEMFEALKRSQREAMMLEINNEVAKEKSALLALEYNKLEEEVKNEVSSRREEYMAAYTRELVEKEQNPEQILINNQIRIENKQRSLLSERLHNDGKRLQDILKQKELESIELQKEQEKEQQECAMRLLQRKSSDDDLVTVQSGSNARTDTDMPSAVKAGVASNSTSTSMVNGSKKVAFGLKFGKKNSLF